MFRHVLVPLDGSPLAEGALGFACDMLPSNGKLTLLSILHMPDVLAPGYSLPFGAGVGGAVLEAPTDRDGMEDYVTRAAVRYMARVTQELAGRTPHTLESVIMTGQPADVIVLEAERRGVDAIVMSTHGRSGLKRLFFGSVTGQVLQNAPCPVLVVPSAYQRQRASAAAVGDSIQTT